MAETAHLAAVPDRPEGIKLTGDRIVVAVPGAAEHTSRAGLLIPATASRAPKRCIWADVLLTGPDVRLVKEGERVLFLPQSGLEVDIDGEEYLLLRERDVQGVATGERPEKAPGQYL